MQWLKLPARKVRHRGFKPHSGLQVSRKQNVSSPLTRKKIQYCGEPPRREVACSASGRQGAYFEFCVWRAVSSHSSHHPEEVLQALFSLYVHNCGLKPHSYYFQPPKQPIIEPTIKSISQPTSQSKNKPTKQPIDRSMNEPNNQPAN